MGKLSRRGFLGILATGAVGACVLAKLPSGLLPLPIRRRAACEFLREAYMTAARAGHTPEVMYAGRELYEAYEQEIPLHWRFTSTGTNDRFGVENLRFKGAVLCPEGRGWTVRVV